MIYNHIIEHIPPGTIYNLIFQLSTKYNNHKICLVDSDITIKHIFEMLKNNTSEIFILHSTGRNLPIFSQIDKYLAKVNTNRIYIYMHVSYNYLIYNERFDAINKLIKLSNEGVLVIAPSLAVAKQYQIHNINSVDIAPGIAPIKFESNSDLSEYYGKIITTCTNGNKKYSSVKGIDTFCNLVTTLSLQDKALIVGNDGVTETGIKCVKLNHNDFLNVLSHSLVYIQLSKYESYNITAIEAKQCQVPIILSNSEGHVESVGNGFIINSEKEAKKLLKEIIQDNYDKTIVYDNYRDSIKTESIDAFYERFKILDIKCD